MVVPTLFREVLTGNLGIYAETSDNKSFVVPTKEVLESLRFSSFIEYDELEFDTHGVLWLHTYSDQDGEVRISKTAKRALSSVTPKVLHLHVLQVHLDNNGENNLF